MARKKKVHFLKSVILASQSPGSNKQLNLESATPLSLPTTSPSQALKETYGQLKDKGIGGSRAKNLYFSYLDI